MKKTLIIFIINLFVILPTLCFGADGHLQAVKGEVSIIHEGSKSLGQTNDFIFSGDIITTGKKSVAGILFQDGTSIILGSNSIFRINSYKLDPKNDDYSFNAFLEKGSAVYESGAIGKLRPKAVHFSTPEAKISIRGTRFIAKVR